MECLLWIFVIFVCLIALRMSIFHKPEVWQRTAMINASLVSSINENNTFIDYLPKFDEKNNPTDPANSQPPKDGSHPWKCEFHASGAIFPDTSNRRKPHTYVGTLDSISHFIAVIFDGSFFNFVPVRHDMSLPLPPVFDKYVYHESVIAWTLPQDEPDWTDMGERSLRDYEESNRLDRESLESR